MTDDDQNPSRPLPIGPKAHRVCAKGCLDGRGLILARKKIEDGAGDYPFRCDCDAGLADDRKMFPLWSSANQAEWIRTDYPKEELPHDVR